MSNYHHLHNQSGVPAGGPEFRQRRGPDFWYSSNVPAASLPARNVTHEIRPSHKTFLVFSAVAMVITAVLNVLLIGVDAGPAGLLTGLVLATIPAAVALSMLMWLDRHEPEPRAWLLFAFGWGASISAFFAIVLNTIVTSTLVGLGYPEVTGSVVVAPIVEEFIKCAGLLIIFWALRREFDGMVDSLVYTGLIGIGFAAMENVLYLGQAFAEGGTTLAMTFILRGVMSPFAHPMFTAAFGLAVGLTFHSKGPWKFFAPFVGYAAAVILHAMWNFAASSAEEGFLVYYLVLQVPLFIALVSLAITARVREGRLVARHAQGYTQAGWFTPQELQVITDKRLRSKVEAWVKRNLPKHTHTVIPSYMSMMGDLAVLRNRLERGNAPHDAQHREYLLLEAMSSASPVIRDGLRGVGIPA